MTGDAGRAPRGVQWLVLAATLAITALAWAYVLWLQAQMHMSMPMSGMADMPGMDMSHMDMSGAPLLAPAFAQWTVAHLGFMFAMWAIMMVGMMTPSVAPTVLLYAKVTQREPGGRSLLAPAMWFLMGYLLAWAAFSMAAVLAQWALESLLLLSPMMSLASQRIGGMALLAIGIYQWLPLKDACLAQCRAPLQFVQQHGGFQVQARGALRLGWLHGGYCIGCCWVLMLLLFVFGIMNLLWIAALMVYVLLEKVVPRGRLLARIAGVAAMVAGVWMALNIQASGA